MIPSRLDQKTESRRPELCAKATCAQGDDSCLAIREVLNRVGDKWSLQVVGHLAGEPMRFNELRRSIDGISQRMLTLTLRGLERDGLVTRTVFPTIPPRVDYALTPVGETLLVPVMALVEWADANRTAITDARATFDAADGEAVKDGAVKAA